MKIPAGTPNITALKNAVHSLVELTESKGAINGSREEFQGRLQSVEIIKWAIICEATSLVMSGALDRLEETENDE